MKPAKFLAVGAINTLFGYSVYGICIFFGLRYTISLFVATCLGVLFNYLSFGKGVFGNQWGWAVFLKFLIAYGIVFALNVYALMFLTETTKLSPYLAQSICIPGSVLLSWVFMNYWVYVRKESSK